MALLIGKVAIQAILRPSGVGRCVQGEAHRWFDDWRCHYRIFATLVIPGLAVIFGEPRHRYVSTALTDGTSTGGLVAFYIVGISGMSVSTLS